MATRRRRERLSQLNKRGHAPKLSQSLDANSGNGYILTWNTSSLSFDIGAPTDIGGSKTAPNIILVESKLIYTEDSVVVCSFFPFNPSDYTAGATIKFQAGITSESGATAQARLYNLDDKEYVATATMTSQSTSPTIISNTLTVGNAAGNLKNSTKNYEVRLDVTVTGGGSASKYAIFGFVGLRVVT
tara:strand:- start:54 stop:614 length:561 start_codon:yes stop_codon:yes gene_type:complete